MSKASSLFKNTAILAIGKLSSQLIGFVLLPLYTHYLNPQEYGFVDLATVYIALLVPALTLQLEMASFRYLIDARNDESQRTRVVSNISLMVVKLTLPWVLIFAVFGALTHLPHTWTILLTGVALLCSNIAQQIARGLGDNKRFAIASAITGAVTLIGAFGFIVWLGMRIDGMLLSVAVANIVATLYLVYTMRLHRYIRRGMTDRALQHDILGYSVPLVPNGVAWWVINASDRTIISIMISTGANGIYAVATKYSAILNSLFAVFSMSWTESASIHIDSQDRDKFFTQVANATVRFFGALGLGLIATIPFIFPLMVNRQFDEAYLYIPIMVIGVLFNVIVGIYSGIYVAKKLTRKVMNTSIVSAVINLVLTVALVPLFGLYAAAFATAVAFLAMAIYRHYDAKKFVNIRYEPRVFVTLTALYGVIMALYYMRNTWASILALTIAITASYLLNRHELGRIKALVVGKLKR